MSFLYKIFPCFLFCIFAGGCIDVSYSGQEFPVYETGGGVIMFRQHETVPENTYRVIGYMRLKAAEGTSVFDFYDTLMEEAFLRGADAVEITSFGNRLVSGESLAAISSADYSTGEFMPPAGGVDGKARYKTVLEARLLVLENRYIAEMESRRESRKEEVRDPVNTGVSRVILEIDTADGDEAEDIAETTEAAETVAAGEAVESETLL